MILLKWIQVNIFAFIAAAKFQLRICYFIKPFSLEFKVLNYILLYIHLYVFGQFLLVKLMIITFLQIKRLRLKIEYFDHDVSTNIALCFIKKNILNLLRNILNEKTERHRQNDKETRFHIPLLMSFYIHL